MNINDKIFQKHCNCQIAVDRNYIPKKHRKHTINSNPVMFGMLHALTTTPPALICVTHRRWLKWLSLSEANDIESLLGNNQ